MKKPNPHNQPPRCPKPPFFPGTVFVNVNGGGKQKQKDRRKQREEREEFLRGGK